MNIKNNILNFEKKLLNTACEFIAVSKTKPIEDILEAYEAGARKFGENKVQELTEKYLVLPKDIEWHMIGHLQRNKVKYIAPFVHLIHSVDSFKLLEEINKEGVKNSRVINCLLQIYIAEEETKFGLSEKEVMDLLNSESLEKLQNIKIVGLMGMATNTYDETQIRKEFKSLKSLFGKLKSQIDKENVVLSEISMGMSGDYDIAIEEGSTLIRVGSSIFGKRNYN